MPSSPVTGRPVAFPTWAARTLRRHTTAALRFGRWATEPGSFPAPRRGDQPGLLTARRASLVGHGDPQLEAGKRTNVGLVAARLDRLSLSPSQPFSFHRVVGPMTAQRGYAPGRELRGGCLVPTVGGGACLASNLLFTIAVELGWTLLERHGHSLSHPDLPMLGLDATLRWPDVDLRFAPDRPVALRACIDGDDLVIEVRGEGRPPPVEVRRVDVRREQVDGSSFVSDRFERRIGQGPWEEVAANRRRVVAAEDRRRSCWTCNETGCWERSASLELR